MSESGRYKDLLFVGVASAVGGLLNYSFHILSSRTLGPAGYSDLAVIFGIITVITTVGSAFQASVARAMGAIDQRGEPRIPDPYTFHVMRVGLGVLVVIVVLSPVLAVALGLQARLFLPVAAFVFAAFGESVATGRLQGLRRFRMMSAFSVAQSIAKVGAVGIAVVFGWRAFGITATIALFATFIVFAEFAATRNAPSIDATSLDTVTRRHLVALIVFWAIQAADAQIARFGFGGELAGRYSATAQLGKAALIIPLMIVQVAFPDMSSPDDDRAHRAYVRSSIEICAVSALVFALLFVTHGRLVSGLLGGQFVEQSHIVWQMAAVCLPYSLANLELSYTVARGQLRKPLVMVVILIAFLASGLAWATSPSRLVIFNLVVAVALFTGLRAQRPSIVRSSGAETRS